MNKQNIKENEIEEDFMTLKEDDICIRCKKNKATLIYTNSQMDFIHGFTEKICQECYDKQMRESNWYKEGTKFKQKDVLKIIDELFSEGFYQYLWTNYSNVKLTDLNYNVFIHEFEKKIKELRKEIEQK